MTSPHTWSQGTAQLLEVGAHLMPATAGAAAGVAGWVLKGSLGGMGIRTGGYGALGDIA